MLYKDLVNVGACNIGDLPGITLHDNSNTLSNDAKAMLPTIASKLKRNADCTITITGYPVGSKTSGVLCNRRVNAIKAYLTEVEGISMNA